MKSILPAFALLALATSAQAETVWMPATACQSKAAAAQAFKLLSDGDKAGLDRFTKEKTASGECAALKKDTTVTMENLSLDDGLVCVKTAGAASCLWMPLGAIN